MLQPAFAEYVSLGGLQATMVVAVTFMLAMDVALDEVIHMSGMRYGLVPARYFVAMRAVVPVALVTARAIRGVFVRSAELVFVDVPVVHVMQMPVVQIIRVIVVL